MGGGQDNPHLKRLWVGLLLVSLGNLGRLGNLVICLSLSSLISLNSLSSLSTLNKICRQSAAYVVHREPSLDGLYLGVLPILRWEGCAADAVLSRQIITSI